MSNLETFKVSVRRGIQYLLPQAKSNVMKLEKFNAEIKLFLDENKRNQERIYEFPPYRMLLSFSEIPNGGDRLLLIASGSAPGRSGNDVVFSPEEEQAFAEVIEDAFPEYKISSMPRGLSAAFKVFGLPKEGGNNDQ